MAKTKTVYSDPESNKGATQKKNAKMNEIQSQYNKVIWTATNQKYSKEKKAWYYELVFEYESEKTKKPEKKHYVTKEKLGTDIIGSLEMIEIKPGTSFLSNDLTSTFNTDMTLPPVDISAQIDLNSISPLPINTKPTFNKSDLRTDTVASAMAVGVNTVRALGTLQQDIPALVNKILNIITEILIAEVQKEVTLYLERHAAAAIQLPIQVVQRTAQIVKDAIPNVGEITKELIDNAKDINVSTNDINLANKEITDKISKMKKQASEKTEKINLHAQQALDKISSVLNHITEGPDWVINQLDKQVGNVVTFVHDTLEKQWTEKDEKMYKDFADKAGERIGLVKAEQTVAKMKKTINEKLNKANQAISMAKTKAITTIKNTLLKVAAKTGVL